MHKDFWENLFENTSLARQLQYIPKRMNDFLKPIEIRKVTRSGKILEIFWKMLYTKKSFYLLCFNNSFCLLLLLLLLVIHAKK